jgi:hypothetical protein
MSATASEDRVCISANRWQTAGGAGFLGLVAVIGASRAWAVHSTLGAILVLALLGGPALLYALDTLRRGPSLIVDGDGFREVRSGRAVRWAEVQDVYALRRQSIFNEHHELVFVTQRGEPPTIEFPLDQLSMSWERVVSLVEEHLGRAVPVRT